MLKKTAIICSVVLAVLIVIAVYVSDKEKPDPAPSEPQDSASQESQTISTTQTESLGSTEQSTAVTQESTAATMESTAATQESTAATKPSKPTETQKPTYSADQEEVAPAVAAFRSKCRKSWSNPLEAAFGEITGSRRFASSRSNGTRAHAGVDFVAPHGTAVYAMTDVVVQRIALFYQNTYAIEVLNDDGSVLRYCEVDPKVKEGDSVSQGQKIGTILRANSGTEMLHLEVYTGEATGKLTQADNKKYSYVDSSKVFQRRWDLMDPTFLTELPCWSEICA